MSNDDNEEYNSKEVALWGAMIIGQARIYDALLMLLAHHDPTEAVELRKRHEKGLHYFPPPIFDTDEEKG